MTTKAPIAQPFSPDRPAAAPPVRLGEVGRDAAKLAFVVLAAGLAGKSGLTEPALALLTAPQLPSVLLTLFGVWLFSRLVMGTLVTSRNGEPLGQQWASLWEPIRLALFVALLIPFAGQGALLEAMYWAVGIGANL